MTLSSVPVLLNEFPVPPSFIPQNITSSSLQNPPPSLPPSLPLPPVPGPSPLSEQDLFHITAATRESVVSVASGSSGPSPNPASAVVTTQPPGRQRTGSVTSTSTNSVRSYSSSNGSLSVPLPSYVTTRAANPDHSKFPPVSVAVNPAILEDDEFFSVDPVEHVLTHTSLADIPRATPSPLPYPGHEPALHNEPISSIDMRDLPALQDDDTTDLDSQAHDLHVQMRAERSKSFTHKLRVRQAVSQTRRNSSPTGSQDPERTPSLIRRHRVRNSFGGPDREPPAFPATPRPDRSDRASSPDIATIIAATPRPRRRSETSSTRSRSRSQSRPRVPKSLPGSRRTSAVGRLSLFSLPDETPRRQSEGSANLASRSLLAYANRPSGDDGLWNDDSFVEDYGVVIGGGDGGFPSVPDEEEAAGESDSSIDLHTPLPWDAFAALEIAASEFRADSFMVATDGNRPGSTVSASTPKSGIFKDERDTIRRRVRHRDGRLLRGGIGLTTGLGWSDSEDEDAPSPLTKRISNLTLSRQSSATSVKTGPRTSRSHPHPLSRSFSSDAKVHPSNSTQNLRRTVVPPTSWQRRNRAAASTLSVSIPEHESPEFTSSQARFSEPPYSRVDSSADSQSNDQVRTPSSSSTQSLPGPITPDVADLTAPHSAPVRLWDRDKTLPPLPLSRGPSIANLRPTESSSDMKDLTSKLSATLLSQSISSGSELSDPVVVSSQTPRVQQFYTAPTPRASRSTPRPLQLSASLGAVIQPGEPASKQGLLLGYNRQLHDQQRARALSGPSSSVSAGQRYSVRPLSSMKSPGFSRSESMDLSLEPGEPRLRPRTGTGMVYKKSSTSLTRAAADVQAQSRLRMPSERTSTVAS
ncbi:hypothetical protein BJY52DRAFT_1184460 [Lactarius psammicola]|nr:hypothetical protein BJY52DRAFT_1184460 [Lactarius psammicola]